MAERWLDELGETFATGLVFLWIGAGAFVYLGLAFLILAFVLVVGAPIRLYLAVRNAFTTSNRTPNPCDRRCLSCEMEHP